MLFLFIDMDDSKLESSSYMVKGVHLLLGEPSDFGFSFAMDVFHKVNHYVQLLKFEMSYVDLLQYFYCSQS